MPVSFSSNTNVTSSIIFQYANDVEAEINARISKKYSLPLAVDVPVLTAISTRETIYRLAVQRMLIQFPPAQQGRHPLAVQHTDDQKLIMAISEGELQLVDSTGAVLSTDTTQMEVYSTTKDYVPTMHEGRWTDMIQDPAKLDDIEADRGL